MSKVSSAVKDWIRNHKTIIFPLLAFIIPLVVRTIPEILMGPYTIGFDTMGFYVPDVLLWLHGGINLFNFLADAPLFYAMFLSIVAAGGPPVLTLKIISPILLGFLGLTIYMYARKGFNWSRNKSVVPALIGTIYFVSLRISWDMLRSEIALIFFFVALTLISAKQEFSLKRYLLLSLVILAAVLSDQLVAVIVLGILVFLIFSNLVRRKYRQIINLIIVSLPSALFFVIFYLSYVQASLLGYSSGMSFSASGFSFASYTSTLISEGGFFLYCFLPLLPLVVIGLWRLGNFQLKSWLILSLILLLLPLTFVSPLRWVILLIFPFAFYATDALSILKKITWKRFKFVFYRVSIIYLVLSTAILSFGFIFSTPEKPFIYFNSQYFNKYNSQIPTSMLQNSVSINDCQNTVNALNWFKDNMNNSAVLLTHSAFYGWALLTLNENQIKYYGFGNPLNAAIGVAQQGYTQIYLIWWVNGQGWYGQPTLPSTFHEVYQSGKIAIYSYNNTLQ